MTDIKQPPPLFTVDQMPVNPLKLSDSATIVYGAISVVNFAVGNIGLGAFSKFRGFLRVKKWFGSSFATSRREVNSLAYTTARKGLLRRVNRKLIACVRLK